jgi:hypothetical protein
MEYIYEDLLDSNFISPPFSSLLVNKVINKKVIDHNVLLFTNSFYTLKLCLQTDISFTSNKLCAILINELNYKNDFSKYTLVLSEFFQSAQGFNPLNTKISFYFIPGIKKISYAIMFLSR